MFIAIEGPNAVGKTTAARAVTEALRSDFGDEVVVATAEPTDSELGRAIRALELDLPAQALALACAADRLDHVARVIAPARDRGEWVVSDRYLPSSLVLQRLDGLELNVIWELNEGAPAPDLTVYLEDDPQTIAKRLDIRGRRTRFETQWSPEIELAYYRDARDYLASRDWSQIQIDCRGQTPAEIAQRVIRAAHK